MVKYRRERDPMVVKVKWKILLYIYLSVGIQMDTYRPIDRPVRMKISLEHDKKSSCVLERKLLFICHLYVLLRLVQSSVCSSHPGLQEYIQKQFCSRIYMLVCAATKP